MGMIEDDLTEDDPIAGTEEAVECPVRARAMETIERVGDLLAAPRPGRDGAAEYERLLAERNGVPSVIEKRAAPERVIRKTKTAPEPPAPPDDDADAAFAEVLNEARRHGIDPGYLREPLTHMQFLVISRAASRDDRERMQKLVDEQSARIAALEKRIAKLESRRGRK
jgi:hypothetical protein